MALSWAIAGGGTGGHVTLALALGEEIARRGESVLFIGTERGMEARMVPEAGFELVALSTRGVLGRGLVGKLRSVLGILAAVPPTWRALRSARADIVISVGGYAAMPAVIAARLRRTPLALLEPNAIPGRVNRLAARFAALVFVGFDATGDALAAPTERMRSVGIPLRRGLIEACARSPRRRKPELPLRVLVFGGSQGAQQINQAVMDALPSLPAAHFEFFHQTGEADRERVADAHRKAGSDASVVAFERDMPARYGWADIAVCRSGALSVAELALVGLPALLVPYPYAADDHQAANARELERAGAGRCFDAKNFDGAVLAEALLALTDDPDQLSEMSAAAASLGHADAAQRVVDECKRLLSDDA